MKKLALSVVVLAVAGLGASLGSVGCSTSNSASDGGASNDSSTTSDSGSGSEASSGDDSSTPADGSGSSSGGEGGSGSGGGDGGTEGGTSSCTNPEAGIPVPGQDGGDNTACESCISTSCAATQCNCLSDTPVPVDDAGTMAPACEAYAVCVYQNFVTALLTSDAGETMDLTNAETACAGTFNSTTTKLGQSLIGCIAGHCTSQCVP